MSSASQASSGSTSLLSPLSSSMAVKHGPCLLTLKEGSRLSKPSAWGNFSESPTCSTRRTTGCGARSTSLWAHRNLFWLLPKERNSLGLGHLWGWVTLWSAEEMLDGQHQRVDIHAHARIAHKGPLQKWLEENLCWVVIYVCPTTQPVKGLRWTEVIYVCLSVCLCLCLCVCVCLLCLFFCAYISESARAQRLWILCQPIVGWHKYGFPCCVNQSVCDKTFY